MSVTDEQLVKIISAAMLLALHEVTKQRGRAQMSADALICALREIGCDDPKAIANKAADHALERL